MFTVVKKDTRILQSLLVLLTDQSGFKYPTFKTIILYINLPHSQHYSDKNIKKIKMLRVW